MHRILLQIVYPLNKIIIEAIGIGWTNSCCRSGFSFVRLATGFRRLGAFEQFLGTAMTLVDFRPRACPFAL